MNDKTGNDNEWNLVQRRRKFRRQRTDVYSDVYWRKNYEDEITYFFSEFPDNFGAREMFRAFANYGRMVDVVIPAKRDKMGRIFGFARFVGVSDPKLFGVKLDNIIIGATKIHVNVPRFKRGEEQGRDFKQQNFGTKKNCMEKYEKGQQRFYWKEKKQDDSLDVQRRSKQEIVEDIKGKRVIVEEKEEARITTKA